MIILLMINGKPVLNCLVRKLNLSVWASAVLKRLLCMHISPYEKGNIFNKDPLRVRKLLLHKYEIMKLNGKIAEKGYTLMPLQVYFKGSLVKVEIGLARGKKLYDKRQDMAKKDQRRELEKDFKVKNLY